MCLRKYCHKDCIFFDKCKDQKEKDIFIYDHYKCVKKYCYRDCMFFNQCKDQRNKKIVTYEYYYVRSKRYMGTKRRKYNSK
jgi:hypothetical protein